MPRLLGTHEEKKAHRRAKRNEWNRQWREANREKSREYTRRWQAKNRDKLWANAIRHTFGLERDMYDAILGSQQGVCAICGDPPSTKRLVVDHEHASGYIRGLLCQRCNAGLGMFRDNRAALATAITYLKERGASWI